MKMTENQPPPVKAPRLSESTGNQSGSSPNLQHERRQLPIFPARQRLVQEVLKHPSVVVIGETGSGKTTQIPQYLYEMGVQKAGMIAVTQPRRVAAITVAERVAQEKSTELGKLVGYTVRFDDMTGPNTRIKYMTDGMLLREAILNPELTRYNVVILDEAHERTVHTDVLFGVVKAAQKSRANKHMPSLKIIVMSATMDVDHFSQYFNDAPVLYLEGRQHQVQVFYAKKSQSDYLFSAIITVFQLHKDEPTEHDILVFLTGQEEIESAVNSIREIAKISDDIPNLVVYPLFAALPPQQQLRAFQPAPKGCRKVIISTNIAETSVTIHGIKFVIDTGMVKAKVFHPGSGLDLLKVVRVSKAQALQRTGRAGREAAGLCYRLYTETEFDSFSQNTIPEIQRCNLSSVMLQLLALGIQNIMTFDFMDKPSDECIADALNQLHLLGAVEKEEQAINLTPLGKKMAAFPLDPRLSKVIISAKDHHCLEEILTIVSLLSVDSVLYTPQNKRDEAQETRKKYLSNDGDHLTLLNMYRACKSSGENKHWCYANYINFRNMKTASKVRQQLREISLKLELPFDSCGQDMTSVRKCLTMGFFMNSAELQKEGEYTTIINHKTVAIHPSSSLFHCKPAYVIYNELVHTSKSYMRDLCVVDPEWLYEAAPTYFKRKKGFT